jgi:hypothetical protein
MTFRIVPPALAGVTLVPTLSVRSWRSPATRRAEAQIDRQPGGWAAAVASQPMLQPS